MWLETIKLAFGNNLILGNAPEALTAEKVATKVAQEERDTESFGLFDSNTSNYNTYYPEVTAEDLKPKDSEFIYPIFRSLSEVVVHKEWNPVDFSRNGVLRKSLKLLKGATVNVDHETSVGNALGAVVETYWEEGYKAKNGVLIPAGINSKFKLDGKSHPRVARAIMMDPPSIHSTSVTVQFLWEKSHPSMSQEEFFRGLGTFDKDGKLITRVATEIKRYHEISLVGHGADPFAQVIKENGEIVNPTWADVSYNSANPTKKAATKYFLFDFKTDLISNSEQKTTPEELITNNDNNKPPMKELLISFAAILGITLGEDEKANQDLIQNGITKLVNDQTTLNNDLSLANAEVERLKPLAEANKGNEALQAQLTAATDEFRTEVLKNYNIIAKGTPQDAVTGLIAKADYATLKALNTQYTSQLENDFPMSCGDCGSKKVTRASAAPTGEDGEVGEDSPSFTNFEDYKKSRRKSTLKNAAENMHKQ